jgi:hypothetical protein
MPIRNISEARRVWDELGTQYVGTPSTSERLTLTAVPASVISTLALAAALRQDVCELYVKLMVVAELSPICGHGP